MLDREEYIEQRHFFRVYRERIEQNTPAQEILASVRDEILTTTKLPMAIDFLAGELSLKGRVSDGMQQLGHYFSPFQTFVVEKAEAEIGRFDFDQALLILGSHGVTFAVRDRLALDAHSRRLLDRFL